MSVRKIVLHPDPVLKEKCAPVRAFDEELATLVRDMAETMYAAPGVGLAAPQVGVTKRVFVADVRDEDPTGEGKLRVFVNPEIIKREGEVVWEEGCLSIPEVREEIKRAEKIVVRAFNEKGEPFELEADGLLSVCIQHENDHLDGVLMFDRMSPLKRKYALKRYLRMLERGEIPKDEPDDRECRRIG
ncbi:MAG: peptide deformylase [Deltaproteobacteria bacterium]|nr:peptide deformylase [Deltaproteobacteria bacterium]